MDTGMPLYSENEDGTITTATDNGDGTYTIGDTTYSMDDNSVLYTTNADGTIVVAGDGNQIAGGGNDDGSGDDGLGGNGTTTETLDDGTVVTLDANGDLVSYVGTDGLTYDANDVLLSEDTIGGGDGNDTIDDTTGYYTDDEGNVYDADGVIVQYADGTLPDESTEGEVAYTDEYGNTFDANGVLIAEADHSTWVSEPDEYGNTYDWDGNIVTEGDHSDFTQQDADGNTFDYYGNLISYADGSTPDDYTEDDTVIAEDDTSDEDIDVGATGGLFHASKGGMPHMAGGGDPPPDGGEDEPIAEEDNGDGTITQYFDDGSSITYNADGDVVDVTESTDAVKQPNEPAFATRGITVGANGQRYSNPQTAAEYQANGQLTGADQQKLDAFINDIPRTSAVANPNGNIAVTDLGEVGKPSGDGTDDAEADQPVGGLSQAIDQSDSYMPPGAVDNGDGTFTLGNEVFDMQSGNPLYVMNDNGDIIYTEPTAQSKYIDNGDGTYTDTNNGTTYRSSDDMPLYRDNAKGGVDLVTDNGDGTYTVGNRTYDMNSDEPLYEERGGTTYDMNGKPLWTTDSAGNIIAPNVTSSGGSGGTSTETPQTVKERIAETKADAAQDAATQDWLKSLMSGLNSYGGSALAGAVLGGLLGNQDIFGGGGNTSNQVDMSTVGKINPRTTDFGIGPANYVGYDQYGTPEAMPELYGNELYQNLNAPGFNEVNPGDYARMDAEMEPQYYDEESGEVAPDDEYAEGMAEGGQPQGGLGGMQTYYTFGTPIDPMQNLYNPQPAPQQPQKPPQGMPPQAAQNQQQMSMSQPVMGMPPGMPQGAPQGQNMGMAKPPMPQQNPMQTGPQGLKSGGLPAWSNVPITAGRLNFRHGAPVHGAGDGQSDDIPAMLADGEYVIDAETVAQIGNGSTKAGAQALDKFRENIRAHKRSAPINKIPPKTKALTSYLRGAK
jgi:hypothetical protein